MVLFSLFKLYTDRGEGARTLAMTLLGAPILISAFPLITNKKILFRSNFWETAFKIFLSLYLLEVMMAIVERIIGQPLLGWYSLSSNASIANIGITEFRCTGMYGHPLYNALMVSTAMVFILVSDLKPKIKFLLWGMGYIAILCFNTRGSIVGNALLLATYVMSTIVFKKRMAYSTKISILVAVTLLAGVAYLLVANGLLGGRLVSMGLVDDSSVQVRIDIIDFITSIPITDYLFGLNYKDYNLLLFRNGLSATENFWIDYLLRYGLFFLVCYIVLYYFYLKEELRYYNVFEKLFVTLAFLLIASTNNSLSTSFVALFYFLFLIRLFNPPTFQKVVKRKFLS